MANQIGWIFGKIPNGVRPPTPHFRKIKLQFFSENVRKSLLQRSKICHINWMKMTSPSLQLFQKFIRFDSAALPLLSIFDIKIKNNWLHELGCTWSVWGKAVFQSLVGKDLLFQTSSWATVTISVWFFSRAALPTGDPDFRNSVLLFPNHQPSTDPTKTLVIPHTSKMCWWWFEESVGVELS